MDQVVDQVNPPTGDQGDSSTTIIQQQDTTAQSLGWRAALSDEYKEHEFVKEFTKPTDFVKAALEIKTERDALNDKLGKAIFKPEEGSTPEQIAAYKAALGIPDKMEDYEVEVPEGQDPTLANWFKSVAHKLGLPRDLAKTLSQEWNGWMTQLSATGAEAQEKAHEEAVIALKNKWGENTNANTEAVRNVYQAIAKEVPELENILTSTVEINGKKIAIGDTPEMLDTFLWLGKKILDDSIVTGSPKSGSPPNLSMNYAQKDVARHL